MQTVMLASGIECSYPTIRHGQHRMDELALTHHYERWREDLQLTRDLGIRFLRYGIPYPQVSIGPDRYDWSFCDDVMAEMQHLGIEPILDLCHFGMPDWLGNTFQNPDFSVAFAAYACEVAQRYPWVKFYTPINEIFVCARFSALFGWWNEQETQDCTYVTAIKHMAKANLLAIEQIRRVQPQAIFIQSESNEYTHSMCGEQHIHERVEWENQMRFLALDLLFCHQVRADIYQWLLINGLSAEEYSWFMNHNLHTRCIMGTDYYVTNERMVDHDGNVLHVGEVFGWYLITRDYYERYHRPVMHTETNRREEDDSVAWLWKQWQNVLRMRADGVPVFGFTWYSLIDQVDWDSALRSPDGHVNALGLYDMDRKIRPVGQAYRKLIKEFNWIPIIHNSDFLGLIIS